MWTEKFVAKDLSNFNFLKAKLRQVGAEELGHAEGADAVASENLGHLLVGVEELLVLGVLEVVLLDVSPQLLDAFGTAGFLLSDNVGELSAELHGLGESGSLGHFEFFWFWSGGVREK